MLGFAVLLIGCQRSDFLSSHQPTAKTTMADLHSAAKPDQIAVTHLSLNLGVDFEHSILAGTVTLQLKHNDPTADTLWLDTKALEIEAVEADGKPTKWSLLPDVPHHGQPMAIVVTGETDSVKITYRTTKGSEAVQWLTAEQTAGKTHPFLFTQGEAILTRSWIPCQDSPGVRISYDANIQTTPGYMALMSAHGNPTAVSADGHYQFRMPLAVAPYLIALSVGQLAFRPYDEVTGVYAEPNVLDKAFAEFGQMRKMVNAAEQLYGPYIWGRYDVLVLPASFPFGGMENPCLTFATPTILAGDQSLVSLVAHELAHSWSGNTVTNATWDDFWLNEGFTVYFERRIMEAIEGKDYADMLAVLGYQDLVETVQEIGPEHPNTCLHLDLKGVNPDDGMNDIAYEKGYFLLRHIEDQVGRKAWDAFLRAYFKRYALQSITTEDFLKALDEDLAKPQGTTLAALGVDAWIYKPGLPSTLTKPMAKRFDAVDAYIAKHTSATVAWDTTATTSWSTHEWLRFLRAQSDSLGVPAMTLLDQSFGFSSSTNAEIEAVWYRLAALNGYEPAKANMVNFLVHTGRRKFLTPTYKAIIKGPWGMAFAREIYGNARPNYHFVATNTLDAVVK